jgi:NAD(P) transhydrogenase subunit alpha
MSKGYQKQQAELVAQTIAKQDIVITTALIPGRPAPRLISKEMIATMKPGSIIVDMAVEAGGNVEGSKAGEVITTKNGVIIIGHNNIASRLATDASALYAKNLMNLVNLITDQESKELSIDWEDDIIKGIALTKDGSVIHPLLGGKKEEPKNEPAKEEIKKEAKGA